MCEEQTAKKRAKSPNLSFQHACAIDNTYMAVKCSCVGLKIYETRERDGGCGEDAQEEILFPKAIRENSFIIPAVNC